MKGMRRPSGRSRPALSETIFEFLVLAVGAPGPLDSFRDVQQKCGKEPRRADEAGDQNTSDVRMATPGPRPMKRARRDAQLAIGFRAPRDTQRRQRTRRDPTRSAGLGRHTSTVDHRRPGACTRRRVRAAPPKWGAYIWPRLAVMPGSRGDRLRRRAAPARTQLGGSGRPIVAAVRAVVPSSRPRSACRRQELECGRSGRPSTVPGHALG